MEGINKMSLKDELRYHLKDELKDWRFNLGRWTKTALITSLLGGVACGVVYIARNPISPLHSPEVYERMDGGDSRGNRLIDFDKDGDVDLVVNSRNQRFPLWVASDMVEELKENGFYIIGRTPRMTPEIQESATQILQAQRNLARLTDSERYKRFVERER